jgi:tetratricopeptide (TPR) repeat protein
MAMLRLEAGRIEEAAEYLLPALETFRQLQLGLWESYTLRILGWLRRDEGRLDVADQYLEDAVNLAETFEDAWGVARARWLQASVRTAQGRPDEAVRLLREAAAAAAEYEEPWQEAEMLAGGPGPAGHRRPLGRGPGRGGHAGGAGARTAAAGVVADDRGAAARGGLRRPVGSRGLCLNARVILIDPPTWPGHGRLWSHLVSDESYAELHTFAAALGVPARGFERDHYDVPAALYDAAIAAGAVAVRSRELVARLTAAGLRSPKRPRRT